MELLQTLNSLFSEEITPQEAILTSATLAGVMALLSIASQRQVAREKATLDIILKSESDDHYKDLYKNFLDTRRDVDSVLNKSTCFLLQSDLSSDDLTQLDEFINHYELIAIGIKKKILSGKVYKKWMRSVYVKHYIECYHYIQYLRFIYPHSKVFENYISLATKWLQPEEKSILIAKQRYINLP